MGNTSPDNITYPDAIDRVGDIQPDFVTLAASTQAAFTDLRGDINAELNDLYGLPAPVTRTGNAVQAITATSWANVPGLASISFNFSREAWVQVVLGGWIVSTAGDLRAGVNVSGATSQAPNVPNWGNTIFQSFDNSSSNGQQATKFVLCGAGTTTFTAQAYQNGGGTKQFNYTMFQAVPLRYSAVMPGGV